MLFDYDLIVPAQTPASSPVEQVVSLLYGTLTEIRCIFPPGPATLVHVVVRDRLHQIFPANTDGDVNFDDTVIVSTLEYELTDSPYELILVGWSPSAVFEHVITFQFNVRPAGGETWSEMIEHLFAL